MILFKVCKKCNLNLSIDKFNNDKSKKDGYRNSCKDCQKKYISEYRSLNKDIIINTNKKWKMDNIEKVREMSKKYYEDNKDDILMKSKKYFKENKQKIRDAKKRYYNDNKDKILSKKKEYIKNRKKIDPLYHLTLSLRSLIKNSFYRKNFNKPSTIDIIGCSYSEFKSYIESLFKDNMCWENYGEWHLDHKIPVSWAKDEEELFKLNHYTNFQPLWSFENQSKSNKFSD